MVSDMAGEGFQISEDDVATAASVEGFASAGSVEMRSDQSYVELDAEAFGRRMKVFAQRKCGSRDIVSRSLKIDTMGDALELRTTDGIAFF